MIEFNKRVESPGEAVAWPWSYLHAALGWGLLTGWLDLALVLAQRALSPSISMASLRTNRHYSWMIPLSDVLLFGLVGIAIEVVARVRPKLASSSWRLYAGMAALACTLEVEGLHGVAVSALAIGVGLRLGPTLERAAARWRAALRGVCATAAVGLIVLSIANVVAVATVERRALAALPKAAADATNIVVIVLDNVRASSLSLYGYSRPTSPNLQRLAREGVLFTEARSTTSWTLPAHASLFTGRWCHELTFGYDQPLAPTHTTLAEALARRGYATAGFVGNTYYANARYGLDRGFARYQDHYENEAVTPFEILRSSGLGKAVLAACRVVIRYDQGESIRKSAAMINRDAMAWIDARPRDRPFFVFLNYFDAHGPFVSPDGPDPRFGTAGLSYAERERVITRERRILSDPTTAFTPEALHLRQAAAEIRRDSYESCIASLDRRIGLLFDEFARRGLRKNTLFVLTSDHGEHLDERGFHGHGLSLYRPETHVPMLMLPPTSAPEGVGRTVSEPVSLRDVAATVVDFLHCDQQSPFPGQSLVPLWRSDQRFPRAPLLTELRESKILHPNPQLPSSLGTVKALIDHEFHFLRNGDGREELYNFRDDPNELRNLIAEPGQGARVSRLRGKLERLSSPAPPERLTRSDLGESGARTTLEDGSTR